MGPEEDCSRQKGVSIWSFNSCTLKSRDFIELAQSFTDSVQWDILCIQEGVRGQASGAITEQGLTIISGEGDAVGATHLILNQRLGSRLRLRRAHNKANGPALSSSASDPKKRKRAQKKPQNGEK